MEKPSLDAGEEIVPGEIATLEDASQVTGGNELPEEGNPAEASLLSKIIRRGLIDSTMGLEMYIFTCLSYSSYQILFTHSIDLFIFSQRQDPDSPLYSVKSFESLHLKPELLKGVYGMGFNAPSKIQETALPALLAEPPQNMIGNYNYYQ